MRPNPFHIFGNLRQFSGPRHRALTSLHRGIRRPGSNIMAKSVRKLVEIVG